MQSVLCDSCECRRHATLCCPVDESIKWLISIMDVSPDRARSRHMYFFAAKYGNRSISPSHGKGSFLQKTDSIRVLLRDFM
jgi:hypothetical protein